MNQFYSKELNRMYEGLNLDDYVIATYLVGGKKDEDPMVKAASMGIEQTTGSWTDVPGETPELREKYAAKTMAVYEVPDIENEEDLTDGLRWYVMKIAYPSVNIDDNLPLFFATVIGNISALPNIKLIDVEFGKKFVSKFKGPKFGIEGVRDILGVHNRPLLNNMIKPCTGYTPEVGAKLFYDAAVGGVDIIKDDELIGGDRAFNTIEERCIKYMKEAAKADAIKGETTMFACNITDEVSRLKENAMKAIKAGTNCIMVDVVGIGFSALRALAEDPEINVPILAHAAAGGALFTSRYQGISSNVMYKLIRLCGADIVVNSSPYGKFDILKSKYIKTTICLQSDFYHIKPSLPLYGGGVIPGLVKQTLEDGGIDCVLGVGAAIHAHKMGPTKGAQAMRLAIDAAMNNVDLREAAKGHEELEVAINTWGIYGEDVKGNYLI